MKKNLIGRLMNLDTDSLKKSISFVYYFTRQHIGSIVFYTVMSLTGVFTGLLSSLISKNLVDIITGQEKGELLKYFILTIVVALVNMAIAQVTNYFSLRISLTVSTSIKSEIFGRMIDSKWEKLSKYHSGDILARLNNDTENISSGVLSFIPAVITNIVRFVGALGMVLWYDWTFAIFALLGIPFSIVISRKMTRKMQNNSLASSKKNSDIYGFTQETFSNIGFIKAFDLLRLYAARFKESLQEFNRMKIDYNNMTIASSIIISLAGLLVSYSSYGWGIYRVWSGFISYGTMTMFLSLSGTLTGSVNSLGSSFSQAISLDTSARRILEIIDMDKDDFSDDPKTLKMLPDMRKDDFTVHFENASFHYEGSDDYIFKDVSLEMEKGKAYACVGPSGEGKTTFIRCLLSLVRLSEGKAYVSCDGKELPLSASTRKFFSIVPQKSTMFSGSVRENLQAADPQASDEEMIEALKCACAWDFVSERGGLDSEVLEGGNGFSSGQIQRIAIARAILRKAPILVLDEATSALDLATEEKVIANMMRDKESRLTVVTTHRPGILKYCDKTYDFRKSMGDSNIPLEFTMLL